MRRQMRCALVTVVQTCALPIWCGQRGRLSYFAGRGHAGCKYGVGRHSRADHLRLAARWLGHLGRRPFAVLEAQSRRNRKTVISCPINTRRLPQPLCGMRPPILAEASDESQLMRGDSNDYREIFLSDLPSMDEIGRANV